ncbi:MAG: efflux RND transporter periplasmic adaptor subunit [bacterium]|nr:efflux RND transporter periplasmic adaptor subunit [bacterium]
MKTILFVVRMQKNSAGKTVVIVVALLLALSVVANVYLIRKSHSGQSTASATAEIYTCPMHPQVVNDHPADCPICGMKLVKKSAASSNPQIDSLAEGVHLSPSQEILANIRVEQPKRMTFHNAQRYPGKVVAKKDADWKFSLRAMARIDSVYIQEPGAQIRKGDKLITVHSPDIQAAEAEYLGALRSDPDNPVRQAAVTKLKSLGLTTEHFDELRAQRKPHEQITFASPLDGVLMERMAKVGEWTMPGMTLLDFVSTNPVWIEAAVNSEDAKHVVIGAPMVGIIGNDTITTTVRFIGSELDMMAKTLPVRGEVRNDNGQLRLGGYLDILVGNMQQREYLSVPEDAVLQTGNSSRVWIKAADGRYRPVQVITGTREGGRIAIIQGLSEVDEVAVSGAYLIDSESQLKNLQAAPTMSHQKEEPHTPTKVTNTKSSKSLSKYFCPMHCPGSDSDNPGKCPVCGMNLELRDSGGSQ